MYQQPFRPPLPNEQFITKKNSPYTFGPHTTVPNTTKSVVFYYPEYNAIITHQSHTTTYNDPPAWLVADWITAKSKGEPLSHFAEICLRHCSTIPILNWYAAIKNVELVSHNSPNMQEHDA